MFNAELYFNVMVDFCAELANKPHDYPDVNWVNFVSLHLRSASHSQTTISPEPEVCKLQLLRTTRNITTHLFNRLGRLEYFLVSLSPCSFLRKYQQFNEFFYLTNARLSVSLDALVQDASRRTLNWAKRLIGTLNFSGLLAFAVSTAAVLLLCRKKPLTGTLKYIPTGVYCKGRHQSWPYERLKKKI